MPEQSPPNSTPRPIFGFAAGTPIRTPEGSKPIEQVRPGDMIQGRPAGEVCEVFVTRKPIFLLHLSGQVIRTTADHPFYVHGQGWTEAAGRRPGDPLLSQDGQAMPVEGVTGSGEQDVVHSLNPGANPMPDQPRPHFPILGFAAGTPLLTP